MKNISELFNEVNDEFTIYVVEQRFVVGQGNEYFKTFQNKPNYISSEAAAKKRISAIISWTQKYVPNIADLLKLCFYSQGTVSLLEIIHALSALFSVHEHQAAGPEVIDPIIIQEGKVSQRALSQIIALHKSSILRPSIIILLKDNDFDRAKKILSQCPHNTNVKMIRNNGKTEIYKIVNTGADNLDDFLDAFSRQCFNTCSRTPRRILLNDVWDNNNLLNKYSPSIFKIRTNLLYDEKNIVRDDINDIIQEIEYTQPESNDELLLIKSFECMCKLFRVYCNDYGGSDLHSSESIAKSLNNDILLAHVYRYSNLFSDRDASTIEQQLLFAENVFRQQSIEDHAIYSLNNRLVNEFYTDSIDIHAFDEMQSEAISNVPGLVGMSLIYNNVGVAYLYTGQYDEAITFFTKGLDYSRDRIVQNLGLKSNILIAKSCAYQNIEERELRVLLNTVFDTMGTTRLPFISANYVLNIISAALRTHPELAIEMMSTYPITSVCQAAFNSNMLGSGSLYRFIEILQVKYKQFNMDGLIYPKQYSKLSGVRANFLYNHAHNPIIFNAWL